MPEIVGCWWWRRFCWGENADEVQRSHCDLEAYDSYPFNRSVAGKSTRRSNDFTFRSIWLYFSFCINSNIYFFRLIQKYYVYFTYSYTFLWLLNKQVYLRIYLHLPTSYHLIFIFPSLMPLKYFITTLELISFFILFCIKFSVCHTKPRSLAPITGNSCKHRKA